MGGLSGYKTKSGQVCAYDNATPSYVNSHYSDFDIFIPYESLPLLSGERTYYISLYIQDANSKKFISERSDYVSFIGTGGSAKKDVNNNSNVRKGSIKVSFNTYNGEKNNMFIIDPNNKTITLTNLDTNRSNLIRLNGLYTIANDIQGKIRPGDLVFNDKDTIRWMYINKRRELSYPRICFSKDHYVLEWFDFYPTDELEFNESFDRLFNYLETTGQTYEKLK